MTEGHLTSLWNECQADAVSFVQLATAFAASQEGPYYSRGTALLRTVTERIEDTSRQNSRQLADVSLIVIWSWCDASSLANVAGTCKRWYKLARSSVEPLLRRLYGVALRSDPSTSWFAKLGHEHAWRNNHVISSRYASSPLPSRNCYNVTHYSEKFILAQDSHRSMFDSRFDLSGSKFSLHQDTASGIERIGTLTVPLPVDDHPKVAALTRNRKYLALARHTTLLFVELATENIVWKYMSPSNIQSMTIVQMPHIFQHNTNSDHKNSSNNSNEINSRSDSIAICISSDDAVAVVNAATGQLEFELSTADTDDTSADDTSARKIEIEQKGHAFALFAALHSSSHEVVTQILHVELSSIPCLVVGYSSGVIRVWNLHNTNRQQPICVSPSYPDSHSISDFRLVQERISESDSKSKFQTGLESKKLNFQSVSSCDLLAFSRSPGTIALWRLSVARKDNDLHPHGDNNSNDDNKTVRLEVQMELIKQHCRFKKRAGSEGGRSVGWKTMNTGGSLIALSSHGHYMTIVDLWSGQIIYNIHRGNKYACKYISVYDDRIITDTGDAFSPYR